MIDLWCRFVLQNLNTKVFVETGIYLGETTAFVSKWFGDLHPQEFGAVEKLVPDEQCKGPNGWNEIISYPVFIAATPGEYKVYTVDIGARFAEMARKHFASNPNIIVVNQDSVKFLQERIQSGELKNDTFFYLDAHGAAGGDASNTNPMRAELVEILKLDRFIVGLDDWFIDGSGWGHDGFDWGGISDLFEKRARVFLYHPVRSNLDNRGWALIFVGYTPEELKFMEGIPMHIVYRSKEAQ